jgi:hypothetical protein
VLLVILITSASPCYGLQTSRLSRLASPRPSIPLEVLIVNDRPLNLST